MPKAPVVLIVDDEQDLVSLLEMRLKSEGYKPLGVYTGKDAVKALESRSIDLVLLDLMLPDMDGIEVCRKIRANPEYNKIPILILSAIGQKEMVVQGLDEGADDYVTKPFSDNELMARVRSLLRRHSSENSNVLEIGDLYIDVESHLVKWRNRHIRLTPTEFKLLFLLASNPARVFDRQTILHEVMGCDVAVTARTVDVHIRSLRKKFGKTMPYINTIRGIGYRFLN